jgi:hypothetical protein
MYRVVCMDGSSWTPHGIVPRVPRAKTTHACVVQQAVLCGVLIGKHSNFAVSRVVEDSSVLCFGACWRLLIGVWTRLPRKFLG